MASGIAHIAQRRGLLAELVRTDLRARDAGTLLGPVWWLLDPLILMLTYWMLVKIIGYGGRLEDFPVFILCGLLPTKFMMGSVASSALLLPRRRSLIMAYPFPTAYLPLSNVCSNLVFFVVSMPVLGVVGVLVFGRPAGPQAIQLLLLIVPMTILTAGCSLIAAALGAIVRDLSNIIAYSARLLTYASPVIYSAETVRTMLSDVGEDGTLGAALFVVYQCNPLALAIEIIRASIYEPAWVSPVWWAVLCAEAIAVAFVGLTVYTRCESRVVKMI